MMNIRIDQVIDGRDVTIILTDHKKLSSDAIFYQLVIQYGYKKHIMIWFGTTDKTAIVIRPGKLAKDYPGMYEKYIGIWESGGYDLKDDSMVEIAEFFLRELSYE